MRCFLAIELPKEVRDELFKIGEGFNSKIAKIKWCSKKNIHLTLKFFGEVSEDDLKKIDSCLHSFSFEPFQVMLGNVGFFPKGGNPRIIFVGLQPEIPVFELQSDVETALHTYFSRDNTFAVHLTLGRVKSITDLKKFQTYFNTANIKPLSFEINSFSLMSSTLSKEGSRYKKLKEYGLN